MKKDNHEIEKLREIIEPISSHVEPPGALHARSIINKAEETADISTINSGRLSYKRTMTVAASLVLVAFLTITASLLTGRGTPGVSSVTKSSVTLNVSSEPEPESSAAPVSVAESVSSQKPQEKPANPLAASGYKEIYTALNNIAVRNGYNNDVYGATTKGTASKATAMAPNNNGERVNAEADTDTPDSTDGTANKSADDLSEEHGETNAQVEGVAEADILQNDGKYLYYFNRTSSAKGNILQIIKADGTGKLEKVSEVAVPLPQENSVITEMMLAGNRLVVMMTSYQYRCGIELSLRGDTATKSTAEVWPDSDYFNSTQQTTAVIYDISDRKNPKLVRTYSQDGQYVSSRLIGNNLYLVSSYTPKYLGNLKEDNVEYYIPKAFDSKGKNNSLPAKCISIAPNADNPTYAVVSVFNVAGTAEAKVEAVLGGGSYVYSSLNKLYVAFYQSTNTSSNTGIISFNVSGGALSYSAFGSVEGTIKNQYFLDEYQGNLRIATLAHVNRSESRMYVLDPSLKIIGSIKGIAPGEDLKSVRFDGKKAYITTAVVTDPLFAIDLSIPTAPKILGELKIPGFSEYKHFIDENTIISIGADGDASGTFSTKLSMFDVTDPVNMKEIHKFSIGDRKNQAYSSARNEPKAFTYIASKKLLCIPVQTNVYENNYAYSRNELHVYSVTKENGFVLKARLTGDSPISEGSAYFKELLSQPVMERSTYIGNALFGICDSSIISIDMTSFKKLSELTLYQVPENPSNHVQTFNKTYPGEPFIISPKAK